MTDVETEDPDWTPVAYWLAEQIERQGLTLRQIESDGGVAYRTVQKLLESKPVGRRDALRRLSEYLGFRADAIDRVRRGDAPVPLVEPDREPEPIDINNRYANMPAAVKRRILGIIEAQERKQ